MLTGATPTSFSDIPSVLRQKVDNVRVAFDPPLEDFSPEDSALGTLYIIERFFSRPLTRGLFFLIYCTTDDLQCPRLPVLHGTRLSDRVPVYNAPRHIARGRRPLRLLPNRRTSGGCGPVRRRRRYAEHARAQLDASGRRLPCVQISLFFLSYPVPNSELACCYSRPQ